MTPSRTIVLAANRGFGIWSSRARLIIRLLESGWNVTAAAAEDASAARIAALGADFVPISFADGGFNPRRDPIALAQLASLYRRLKPDLVHHFNFKPILYGGLAARATGRPAVVATVTGAGYAFASGAASAALASAAYRVGLRDAAAAIFQNPDDRDMFLSRGIVRPEAVRLIVSSGVDTATYRPAAQPVSRPVFLMVSRLLWQKGVREYVAAAGRLRRDFPDARFLLGGELVEGRRDGVPEEWIRARADAGDIEFIGYVRDMPRLLREISVFVFPSRYREGVPRVLLEAASSGAAVITADSPGCREAVRHGVNGLIVPPGDTDALTAAMRDLLEHPGTAHRLGQAGRDWMTRDFRIDAVIDKTIQIYREAGINVG